MSSGVLVKLYPLKMVFPFIPVGSQEVEQIKIFFFIIQNPQDPMFFFFGCCCCYCCLFLEQLAG